MYKIQWYNHFFHGEWEDSSSHWFFYKARKRLCKMISTGKYCQGQWRIVNNEDNVYLHLNVIHGYNPEKDIIAEKIKKVYKNLEKNYEKI